MFSELKVEYGNRMGAKVSEGELEEKTFGMKTMVQTSRSL